MLLSVHERLVLINLILPKEGNFLTLEIVAAAKTAMSLTEKEIKDWEVTHPADGGIKWNDEKAVEVKFSIGDALLKIISEVLTALDNQKKLTAECMSLYKKFMLPAA